MMEYFEQGDRETGRFSWGGRNNQSFSSLSPCLPVQESEVRYSELELNMRTTWLSLLAIAAGCGGTGAPLSPVDGGGSVDSAGDGSAAFQIEGRIIGLDEKSIPGVTVSLCKMMTCRDATTGAQGEFTFTDVQPDFYTL